MKRSVIRAIGFVVIMFAGFTFVSQSLAYNSNMYVPACRERGFTVEEGLGENSILRIEGIPGEMTISKEYGDVIYIADYRGRPYIITRKAILLLYNSLDATGIHQREDVVIDGQTGIFSRGKDCKPIIISIKPDKKPLLKLFLDNNGVWQHRRFE